MKIINHRPHICHIAKPAITLLPGLNVIGDDAWSEAVRNPLVAKAARDKHYEIIADPKAPTTSSRIAEVNATVDIALLQKQLATESDGAVKAAINARLEALKPAKK